MKPDRDPFETDLSQALKQVEVPGDLKAILIGLPDQSQDPLAASLVEQSQQVEGPGPVLPIPSRLNNQQQVTTALERLDRVKRWRVSLGIGAAAAGLAGLLLAWSWQFFTEHQAGRPATNELADRDNHAPNAEAAMASKTSLSSIQQQIQDLELEWMWLEEQRVLARINQLTQTRPRRIGLEHEETLALTLVATAETSILAGHQVPSTKADLEYVLTKFPETSSAHQAQALLGQLKF